MKGTEKQIAYANSLMELFTESYNAEIAENADAAEYTEQLAAQRDQVIAWANDEDRDAGKIILWFKGMGRTADFMIARSLYKKWEVNQRLRARCAENEARKAGQQ